MARSRRDQGGLEFTRTSLALLKKRTSDFGGTLTAQCQSAARREGHPTVTDKHVEDAYRFLMPGTTRTRSLLLEFGGTFGGVVLGVGLAVLENELLGGGEIAPNPTILGLCLSVLGAVSVAVHAVLKA